MNPPQNITVKSGNQGCLPFFLTILCLIGIGIIALPFFASTLEAEGEHVKQEPTSFEVGNFKDILEIGTVENESSISINPLFDVEKKYYNLISDLMGFKSAVWTSEEKALTKLKFTFKIKAGFKSMIIFQKKDYVEVTLSGLQILSTESLIPKHKWMVTEADITGPYYMYYRNSIYITPTQFFAEYEKAKKELIERIKPGLFARAEMFGASKIEAKLKEANPELKIKIITNLN